MKDKETLLSLDTPFRFILAVGGVDSINIEPGIYDVDETNTINTQCKGWRGTAGLR